MKTRQKLVVPTLQLLIFSLFLLINLVVLSEHSSAQKPAPGTSNDDDCPECKALFDKVVSLKIEASILAERLKGEGIAYGLEADRAARFAEGKEREAAAAKRDDALQKLFKDGKALQDKLDEEFKAFLAYAECLKACCKRRCPEPRNTTPPSPENSSPTPTPTPFQIHITLPSPTPTPTPFQIHITLPSPTPTPTPTATPAPSKKTGNQVGYHVGTNAANGLFVTTFDTPQGTIKVNLTDDVATGDTISGTVETEPTGKGDAERAQNQAELSGYVIEIEGKKTTVVEKKISWAIPTTLTSDAKLIVLEHRGQTVATSEIPISQMPTSTPTQTTLPTGGQQGRTIECRGNFPPTDQVSIGGSVLPEVARSPRKIVVRNTSETLGPTTIKAGPQECPFRNISIKLSAPRLNLQRGETTTLHVVVMGLAGITQGVPLDLVNNSPNVIKMAGGEVQHLTIQPGQVQAGGTYTLDLTLTGTQAGGFGITGTVKWDQVCKQAAVSTKLDTLSYKGCGQILLVGSKT